MRDSLMTRSIVALLALLLTSSAAAQTGREPANHVVIMIDASGSYRKRQTDAVERSVALLDTMAQTKLHRWEPATDYVSLISLDAMPDVLWHGTLRDLKKLDRAAWTSRFHARTDYAKCTDVSAAFQLAAQHLTGDARFIRKYLFVFSDLIHEPPTTAITKCQRPKRPSLPSADFPWGALQDVSVAVFWVPPDQKLAWRRVVGEQGLSATFALYTDSESADVTITPPPRPTPPELTEAERATERARYVGYATTLGKGLGSLLAVIVLGPVVAVAIRRLWLRRTRLAPAAPAGSRRPGPGGPRQPGAPWPPPGPRPLRPRPRTLPNTPRP